MKRFITLLLILPTLMWCSEEPEVVEAPTVECYRDWEEMEEENVITVLAENSPATYFIYRGRNMGYEYELLHEFAKDMDIRLQIKMVNDLDEMIHLLDSCQGDIIACNLTITEQRKERIDFTSSHLETHQVLIQRTPDPNDSTHADTLITMIEQLKNKTVHVWKSSSYYEQMLYLNNLFHLDMTIIGTEGDLITEELIRKVSLGEIDYTVADENVANIDLRYYDNLDVSMRVSEEQSLAFGIRKTSTTLRDTLNYWIESKQNRSTIGEVRRKYFDRKSLSNKANQEFSSLNGNVISPYDSIIQRESQEIGWDWRLVSSIIYQESKFETYKESWAGAFGIFQFMPATAASYGISPSSSAEAQIRAGIRKLKKNYDQWLDVISDSTECIYFTLATFNAGRAHVDDARALCGVYELDSNQWFGNADQMILNLSKPTYYRDKVVRNGYCRGRETYEYVIEVMARFEEYQAAFPDSETEMASTSPSN